MGYCLSLVFSDSTSTPTSTKFVCLASLTVTTAWTSSINFYFSSSSKCMYHLASRVLPARFWIKMNRICKGRENKSKHWIHRFQEILRPKRFWAIFQIQLSHNIQNVSIMMPICKTFAYHVEEYSECEDKRNISWNHYKLKILCKICRKYTLQKMRMLELENWQITSPFTGRRFLNSLW